MKKTTYHNAQFVTTNELDFTEKSKARAIEQTRFDFLEIRGIIQDSGMTSGHLDDPLKVFLTEEHTMVNVYSGVAYDAYEKRSRRIWVPDDPSDVPADEAQALSNHDNIDVEEEHRSYGFGILFRPARTNIKTFTTSDAAGDYYVCIRYAEGSYDPITIPSDGHTELSKTYEAYAFSVTQQTAIQLGEEWIQLATLRWDGDTLLTLSDDRVLASATVSKADTAVIVHQDKFHDNGIVRQYGGTTDYLACAISNALHRVEVSNTVFEVGDGVHVNGFFVTEMQNAYVDFSDDPSTGIYYIYVSTSGNILRTTDFSLADRQGAILCSVYYNDAEELLYHSSAPPFNDISFTTVLDRRRFGTIGEAQFQFMGLPSTDRWSPLSDLSMQEVSDEFIRHRGGNNVDDVIGEHGCGIIHSGGFYAVGSGTLATSAVGSTVTVNGFVGSDYALAGGRYINSLVGPTQLSFAGETSDEYFIYLKWVGNVGGSRYKQAGDVAYTSTISAAAAPDRMIIARVVYDGGAGVITALNDWRIYGTHSYVDTQWRVNSNGHQIFPDLISRMWGWLTLPARGTSEYIYLTDDWGSGYGGGGSSSNIDIFYLPPLIMVYIWIGAVGEGYGTYGFGGLEPVLDVAYYIQNLTRSKFKINYDGALADLYPATFYWIATGVGNITGTHNPHLIGYGL